MKINDFKLNPISEVVLMIGNLKLFEQEDYRLIDSNKFLDAHLEYKDKVEELCKAPLELQKQWIEFLDPVLSNIHNEYVKSISLLEKTCAYCIMNGDKDLFSRFHSWYSNLLINEYLFWTNAFEVKPKKILFIGSGAMPMSAILMKEIDYTLSITLLDKDEEAQYFAEKVLNSVNLKLNLLCKDLNEFKQFQEYDLVILASSVGSNPHEKYLYTSHIFSELKAGQLLNIRSPKINTMGVLRYSNIDNTTLDLFKNSDTMSDAFNLYFESILIKKIN